jgi:hypothetical protein
MAQGIARGVGAACFLVLPVLLLGSCMRAPQPAALPATDFLAVIDDTQRLVGGVWENQDDPNSRGCVLADGSSGSTFSALRISTSPVEAAQTTVAASWEDLGYSVQTMAVGPVAQLIGTGELGEQLIFRLSDRAMTLQGESGCRPSAIR